MAAYLVENLDQQALSPNDGGDETRVKYIDGMRLFPCTICNLVGVSMAVFPKCLVTAAPPASAPHTSVFTSIFAQELPYARRSSFWSGSWEFWFFFFSFS